MFEKKKKELDLFRDVIPAVLGIGLVLWGLLLFARCCPRIIH